MTFIIGRLSAYVYGLSGLTALAIAAEPQFLIEWGDKGVESHWSLVSIGERKEVDLGTFDLVKASSVVALHHRSLMFYISSTEYPVYQRMSGGD